MKKKIYLSFGLILCVFIAGSLIAVHYITTATFRMDRLIMLHQVEILREDLIIRVQQVQSHLYRNKNRSDGDVDALIAQVQEMDRVMDSCVGCHHTPELAQGILGMRDMANDYKTAISRLITASANPVRIASLEHRAQDLGQELISMTQSMAFTANVRLQQKTQETMATIGEVRNVLLVMLLLGILTAFFIAFFLEKRLNKQLLRLLNATRRISHGDLQHRVDISDARGTEFAALAEAFNAMTQNLHLSQRQLVQSAKLAAIGELATNIAYEINDPLTGVSGHVGLLLKAEDIPAEKKERIRVIERETFRAQEILKNLLNFSRRKPPQLVKTDITGVIQDTIPLVKEQARMSNVEITVTCHAGIPLVLVDSDEIRHVFVNLINNAVYSMPNGGILAIRFKEEKNFAGKDFVAVELADTGHGIPEEQLDKIFDPFFTTRPNSEGPGLGLSISYMIVQNHGGRIEVESKVGVGSTFRVILPV